MNHKNHKKNDKVELVTDRLVLRQWKLADYSSFAALNRDPEVMKYCPSPLTERESNELARRLESHLDRHGWGLWAVQHKADGKFIGCVGLQGNDHLPCGPCVELTARLARASWRRGLALEAAQASLRFAFDILRLDEVVSVCAKLNAPCRALMRRLGMQDSGHSFRDPAYDSDSLLREQVLYSISRRAWEEGVRAGELLEEVDLSDS